MKKFNVIPLFLIITAFTIGLLVYPHLPQMLASHWGVDGQVNGYTSRNFGVFFLPCLLIALFLLFRFLPLIDPYKKNFRQFEHYFNQFVVIILSFLFYIYLLTLAWNLGYRFNMIQLMSPGLAAIFYFAGVLTSVAKQNWFVGIRTPWTLSNEKVWNKTHALGGQLFKAVGLIMLVGMIFPNYAFFFILVPILFITVFLFLYSYLEFQKTRNDPS